MEDKDIYPLTILSDRYNGVYSGGKFIAFNIDYWEIPDSIGSGDFDEENFYSETDIIYGIGNTVQECFDDLYNKINKKPC